MADPTDPADRKPPSALERLQQQRGGAARRPPITLRSTDQDTAKLEHDLRLAIGGVRTRLARIPKDARAAAYESFVDEVWKEVQALGQNATPTEETPLSEAQQIAKLLKESAEGEGAAGAMERGAIDVQLKSGLGLSPGGGS